MSPVGGSSATRRSPLRSPLPPSIMRFLNCGGAGVGGSGWKGAGGGGGKPPVGRIADNIYICEKLPTANYDELEGCAALGG